MLRRKKIVLICLGVLVAIQGGTYLLFASASIPDIALQRMFGGTPPNEKPSSSWICLSLDCCENLTDRQKAKLRSLLGRRFSTVYENASDIPESQIIRDVEGRWVAYHNGFSFKFSVISHGAFWVKVRHSYLSGNLSASISEHVHIWLLGFWVKLHDGMMMVA